VDEFGVWRWCSPRKMARGCEVAEVEIFAVSFSCTCYEAVSAVCSSRAPRKIFS